MVVQEVHHESPAVDRPMGSATALLIRVRVLDSTAKVRLCGSAVAL